MGQKILTSMTVKKQLRLNAATGKNYEPGQIHAVRGATMRMVNFNQELGDVIMTPAALLGYGGVLYYKMGPACLIGMSLFAVTICIDQYLNKSLSEHQHEENKVKEKRLTLTTETFESIKTIKFYGWDESFMNKILGFRENEIKASEKIA